MTGWMRHKQLASVLILLCSALAQADEQDALATEMDEAFLLFLADWEDEQGNWQDPLEYDDPKWTEMDSTQVTHDEQTYSD